MSTSRRQIVDKTGGRSGQTAAGKHVLPTFQYTRKPHLPQCNNKKFSRKNIGTQRVVLRAEFSVQMLKKNGRSLISSSSCDSPYTSTPFFLSIWAVRPSPSVRVWVKVPS